MKEPEEAAGTAMVTSPDRLASLAGRDVLRSRGNAIEAAVAMGAVLSVTYPHFCGIGGDAVWMVADRDGRATCFLGIGQAIAQANDVANIETRGPGAVLTTAGAVDSWGHALEFSRREWYGQKPLQELLEPAIAHARDGFEMTASQRFWLDFRKDEVAGWPGFEALFGGGTKDGKPFVEPELADTLGHIGHSGTRAFYEGPLAHRIADGLAKAGARLTMADLAQTRTREVPPLALETNGVTLLAPPPPTQGVTTLQIMGILARLGLGAHEEGSAGFYHACVEAVKQAFLDRRELADPADTPQPVAEWLAADHLDARAGAIDPDRALEWPYPFRKGDTVFFAATDAQGRSVSVLQSIYFDWGSGVVAGDTGILWHNRGAAFTLEDRHPNRLRPGRLPFFTLNPGIALKDGRPRLLYGTQGADGQPQTLAVVLARMLHYGFTPARALAAPRFLLGRTFSDTRDTLKLEADAGEDIMAELAVMGHLVSPIEAQSPLSGQAGLIMIGEDGTVRGAHDPRSDGCALAV